MTNFRYLNLNPYGNDTEDCTIRAISLFLDQSWDETYLGVVEEGFIQKKMPSTNDVWREYLYKRGCRRTRLPNYCPDCYTVNDFCEDFPYGDYLVKVEGHVVAVVDGCYYDTWDSGDEIALYYWKKER